MFTTKDVLTSKIPEIPGKTFNPERNDRLDNLFILKNKKL